MVIYKCEFCYKNFYQKSHFDVHIARKNKCYPTDINNYNFKKNTTAENPPTTAENPPTTAENPPTTAKNPPTTAENPQNTTNNILNNNNEYKCIYCNKLFIRKDSIKRHIKKSCPKAKEYESKKEEHFQKLMDEILFLKKQNESLHNNIAKIQHEHSNNNSNNDINNNINSNSNNDINNNNIINANNTNNTFNNIDKFQNIVLVGYNKEDLGKINVQDFIKSLRRGFQAPIELTKAVHFNPLLPEFHNIYIPKFNEKNALCYDGTEWKIVDKDELADDIYENKKAHIIDKWEDFADQLTETQIKALNRWFNTHNDDDNKKLKNDIKKVLYEKRYLPIETKKSIDKKNKIKTLNKFTLPLYIQ
jgi:hypothetical protein